MMRDRGDIRIKSVEIHEKIRFDFFFLLEVELFSIEAAAAQDPFL